MHLLRRWFENHADMAFPLKDANAAKLLGFLFRPHILGYRIKRFQKQKLRERLHQWSPNLGPEAPSIEIQCIEWVDRVLSTGLCEQLLATPNERRHATLTRILRDELSRGVDEEHAMRRALVRTRRLDFSDGDSSEPFAQGPRDPKWQNHAMGRRNILQRGLQASKGTPLGKVLERSRVFSRTYLEQYLDADWLDAFTPKSFSGPEAKCLILQIKGASFGTSKNHAELLTILRRVPEFTHLEEVRIEVQQQKTLFAPAIPLKRKW